MPNKPLRIALIAEDPTENERLAELFEQHGAHVVSIGIGELALTVTHGTPGIICDGFTDIDGVFLQVPGPLLLFVEPFLTELLQQGVYCQLKPVSFNLLCNKPLLYATLNARGVQIQKTTLIPEGGAVEAALKSFSYPVYLEAFHGLDKTQQMLIEDKSTLKSYLKSIPFTYDLITAKEFAKVDMEVSLVIGDEIFTVKKKWVEKDLAHAKSRITTKLRDEQKENVLKAVKAIGLDIGIVKTKNGHVVGVSAKIPVKELAQALNIDIYEKIVQFYMERLQ